MTQGTFTTSFELHIPGAAVPETPETSINTSVSLSVDSAGDRVKVVMRYEGVTEAEGALKATVYIEGLVRQLTLKYANILHAAVTYKLAGDGFVVPGTSSESPVLTIPAARLRIGDTAPQVQLISHVSASELSQSLQTSEARRLGPPAWANELVIAREMFYVGMLTENVIVRFLILYSALTLFSTFKGAHGTQSDIDGILAADDPTLAKVTTAVQQHGTTVQKTETEYTQARNAFIHAEGRSRDPQAAAQQIERLKDAFQRAVGRILLNEAS